MITNYLEGLFANLSAFGFISKHRLWSYFFTIGLISLLLGSIILGGVGYYIYLVIAAVGDVAWWKTALDVLKALAILAAGLMFYKNLVIVVAGPFMGALSQKVERIMTGKSVEAGSGWKQFMRDNLRGIRVALRAVIRELLFTIPLLLLNFIPLIGSIISTVLIFLVQAYYAGAGNMDFVLERARFSVKDSIAFARKHRWASMGAGSGFLLLLLVPIVGFVFAPVIGTVSATMVAVKRLER